LGSIGHIPVALNDFRTVFSLKEDTRACQNRGKKSVFLIEIRPWALWIWEVSAKGVGLGEWLKINYIQWLMGVSWIRREEDQEGASFFAILNEIHSDMRSMAIKDR
jgi:hypothetical protein